MNKRQMKKVVQHGSNSKAGRKLTQAIRFRVANPNDPQKVGKRMDYLLALHYIQKLN